jgi:hypothetical protein
MRRQALYNKQILSSADGADFRGKKEKSAPIGEIYGKKFVKYIIPMISK